MGFEDELFYETFLGAACQKLGKIKILLEILSLKIFRMVSCVPTPALEYPYDYLWPICFTCEHEELLSNENLSGKYINGQSSIWSSLIQIIKVFQQEFKFES